MGNLERVHIQHYYSKNSGAVPQTEQLLEGEIALNIQDEKLFFKNAEGEVVALSGGEKSIEVTYGELVGIRNRQELIPGAFYRITDYQTTTSQENTSSAGHQFDVIVLALSMNTLSEDAWAIQHAGDTYFSKCNLNAWKLKYCLDNNTDRFAWAEEVTYDSSGCYFNENVVNGNSFITPFKAVYFEEFDNEYDNMGYMKDGDYFTTWGYKNDPMGGGICLSIYKTDLNVEDENSDYYGPDYFDQYVYRGKTEIDGVTYDKWQKFEGGTKPNNGTTLYAYTESMVIEEDFTLNGGKGVIYRMIDEWGNDCPYDFKNILFGQGYNYTFSYERGQGDVIDASIFGNDGTLKDDGNEVAGVYNNKIGMCTKYEGAYTFNKTKQFLNDIVFLSDWSYDDIIYHGCFNNKFGVDCRHISFGNFCFNNTFGDSCVDNTFGNDCYNNTFGDDCRENTFGDDCRENTFGNECYSINFWGNSYQNEIGNKCRNIIFVCPCSNNKIGNYCYVMEFGHYDMNGEIYNNIIGDDCHSIYLDGMDTCYNIIEHSCYEIGLSGASENNIIGDNCDGITLYDSYKNKIGKYCYDVVFDSGCCNNTIEDDCSEIYLGCNCESNIIGNGCSQIDFITDCGFNEIGDRCNDIEIYDGCYYNKIGRECYIIYIGESCNCNTDHNTIGDYCGEIYLDNPGTNYNTIGNCCTDIDLESVSEHNVIGNNSWSIYLQCGSYNEFGNACSCIYHDVDYVNSLSYNVFGDNCHDFEFSIIPGEEPYIAQYNTFGNYCHDIILYGDGDICNNSFGNNCVDITWEGSAINCTFVNGLNGVTKRESRNCNNMKVSRNSNGELKIYNEADLIA